MEIDLEIDAKPLRAVNKRGTAICKTELCEGASKIDVICDYSDSPASVKVWITEPQDEEVFEELLYKDDDTKIRGTVTWNEYKLELSDGGPALKANGEILSKVYRVDCSLPVDDVPTANISCYGIETG